MHDERIDSKDNNFKMTVVKANEAFVKYLRHIHQTAFIPDCIDGVSNGIMPDYPKTQFLSNITQICIIQDKNRRKNPC